MAERGGLVGLNYCSGFLDDQPRPQLCRSTTALMAKHAAHFKQVGGIEIIGLGSDFDGIGGKLEMDDCSKLPLLAEALRKEGFTEDEVERIFYRNASASLRRICKNRREYSVMDKNMTLEKRIAAELYSYQGKMSVFVDDLQGHTVEIGADAKI